MKKLTALLMIALIVLFSGCDFRSQARLALSERNAPSEQARQPDVVIVPQATPVAPEPEQEPAVVPPAEPHSLNGVGRPSGPMIALTFDDGPGRYTDQVLDVLERHGGQATFFVLGYRIEGRRDTLLRAHNLGSEIAGHSWSHPRLIHMTDAEITHELRSTSAAIAELVGFSPPFYRPPYGQLSDDVERVSRQLGYSMINWTLDTRDWEPPNRNVEHIYNAIMSEVKDGAIILLHDVHASTAQAMEVVIPRLIAEGYELVTVSQLLAHLYGELEPGRVYGNRQ